jgi:hypothetical protein
MPSERTPNCQLVFERIGKVAFVAAPGRALPLRTLCLAAGARNRADPAPIPTPFSCSDDQLFLQVDFLSFHLVQKSPVTSIVWTFVQSFAVDPAIAGRMPSNQARQTDHGRLPDDG